MKQLSRYLHHPLKFIFLLWVVFLVILYFSFEKHPLILLLLVLTCLAAVVVLLIRFFSTLIIDSSFGEKLRGPSSYQKLFQIRNVTFYLRHEHRPWPLIYLLFFALMIIILSLVIRFSN
jgi:hypothetical protein